MNSTLTDQYAELGKEVPVSQIDRELRALWEQDDARTNASLMNLVVYSEHEGGLLENSRIINDLTRENACRAILVEINRDEDASLRAWITAHCHLSHGMKSICCEQISFRLTGRVTGRFRNTVFSHLNSDLPLVFWWQGNLSDVFTERLASVIDRLIIDSSMWTNPVGDFNRLREAMDGNTALIVQDLAWTRCWQFRVGIASLFDNPIAQEALEGISTIRIRYGTGHRNTALQILAWLTVQADWNHRGAFVFENKQGETVRAEISEAADTTPLGIVELVSGKTTVRITHETGSTHLLREIISEDHNISSLSPADPLPSQELVAQQLSRGGKNSLFLKVLPVFLDLLNEV